MKALLGILIGGTAAWALAGCTPSTLPSLPDEVRSQLGSIELQMVDKEPVVEVSTPPRGWLSGCVVGLAEGLLLAPIAVLAIADPALASAALLPIVDPVVGAVKALPGEEVDRLAASLKSELRSSELREIFREDLRSALAASRGTPADPELPARSILEVRVESVRLSTLALGVYHDQAVSIVVSVRIFRACDRAVLYEGKAEWRSGEHRFRDWPRLLDAHLRLGFKEVAAHIARTLFTRPRISGSGPI